MRKRIIAYILTTITLFTALPGICAEPQPKKKASGRQVTEQPSLSHLQKRIALVIGNANYSPAPLTTARNDAHVVAATLRRIGFEVDEKADLNTAALKKAVAAYSKKAKDAEIALFYFNGHALQLQGDNYLIPVQEEFTGEKDVRAKAVKIDVVIDGLRGGSSTGIVVLDASRIMRQFESDDSVSPGLAPMLAPDGTIIAFAAAPDAKAPERSGSNGIYAETLAQALDTPGLTIGNVFRQVRAQIETKTARTQTPWESNSLTKELVLVKPFDPAPALSKNGASEQTKGGQSVTKSP